MDLPEGGPRVWTSVNGVDATGEVDVVPGEERTIDIVVREP